MKKLLVFSFALLAFSFLSAQEPAENHPESVCRVGGVHFFSNTTGRHIHSIQRDGTIDIFAANVGQVLGLAEKGDFFYAAVNRGGDGFVLGFRPPSNQPVKSIMIPRAGQLNDIAIGPDDILYVTDRKADKVYAVNTDKSTFETIIDGDIKTPNGIWLDQSLNRLLICNTIEDCSLYAYGLGTQEVTELFKTGKPHLDGLAMDQSGNTYVTSWSLDWTKSQLIRYSPTFKEKIIQENENGMADLYLYPDEQKIALANWYTNRISIVTWKSGKVEEILLGNN